MSRGGIRTGAGRKPAAAPKRALTIRATEDTIAKVKFLRRYKIDVNAKFAQLVDELAADWQFVDDCLHRYADEQKAAARAEVTE